MIECYTKTSIGYSHIKQNKVCQDYSECYKDDERNIISASDGHGGKIYIRSDKGSRFASLSIREIFKEIKYKNLEIFNDKIEENIKIKILCRWNEFVENDILLNPFNEKELNGLNNEEKENLINNPEIAYGSTLNAIMTLKDKLICVSVGDGGCLLIKENKVEEVFESDDENVANFTSSLCETDAFNHIHIKVVSNLNLDGALVFTDGFINPFQNLDNLNHLFIEQFLKLDDEKRKENIEYFVNKMGTKIGIGDDVSLGILWKKKDETKCALDINNKTL